MDNARGDLVSDNRGADLRICRIRAERTHYRNGIVPAGGHPDRRRGISRNMLPARRNVKTETAEGGTVRHGRIVCGISRDPCRVAVRRRAELLPLVESGSEIFLKAVCDDTTVCRCV